VFPLLLACRQAAQEPELERTQELG